MQSLFASVIGTSFTVKTYLICIGCAFVCGLICCLGATFKSHSSKSYRTSLMLLPMIVTTVILMVNGSIGTGIAVAGTFSLVRFRSVPGDAKQILSIFLAVASGLACACGYVALAILFTAIVAALMCGIVCIELPADRKIVLRMWVPETVNYTTEFNSVFEEFTNSCRLTKAKTANMGSVYKLYYSIEMKDPIRTKDFIDALRTRNGNLEVMLCSQAESGEEL